MAGIKEELRNEPIHNSASGDRRRPGSRKDIHGSRPGFQRRHRPRYAPVVGSESTQGAARPTGGDGIKLAIFDGTVQALALPNSGQLRMEDPAESLQEEQDVIIQRAEAETKNLRTASLLFAESATVFKREGTLPRVIRAASVRAQGDRSGSAKSGERGGTRGKNKGKGRRPAAADSGGPGGPHYPGGEQPAGFSDDESGRPDKEPARPPLVPQVPTFLQGNDLPEPRPELLEYIEQTRGSTRREQRDIPQEYKDQINEFILARYTNKSISTVMGCHRATVNYYRMKLLDEGKNVPFARRILAEVRGHISEGIYSTQEIADAYGYKVGTIKDIRQEMLRSARQNVPIEVRRVKDILSRIPVSLNKIANYLGLNKTAIDRFFNGREYIKLDRVYNAALRFGADVSEPGMQELDQLRHDLNAFLYFTQPGMTKGQATTYLQERTMGKLGMGKFAVLAEVYPDTISDAKRDLHTPLLSHQRLILEAAQVTLGSKASQLYFFMGNKLDVRICSLDEFLRKSAVEQMLYWRVAHALEQEEVGNRLGINQRYVSAIEKGVRKKNPEQLSKLITPEKLAALIGTDNPILLYIISERLQGRAVTLTQEQRQAFLNHPHALLVTDFIEQAQRYQGR